MMRLTEKHILHFNSLHGQTITRGKLKKFHDALQADITAKRIDAHVPGGVECIDILKRLSSAIHAMNGKYRKIEKLSVQRVKVPNFAAPPPAAFVKMQKKGKLWPAKRRNPVGQEKPVRRIVVKQESKPKNLVAEEIPISTVYTDTSRFQNRQDAFSEASANAVAEHYDPNKFDPIVVWLDSKAKKIFVLSGHSRYEGMKRRKAKTIAVRYFKGSEEDAIKFAKVEANRGATQETLIEDLAAYRLMRDGDEKRGIKKLTKSELQKIFKGKVQKLEAYSYLAPGGLFVNALSQSNTSNYPYLERNAQWVGQIRKDYKVISNTGEDNIFHFFYSDKTGKHLKLSKDEFFKLVQKRINQLGKNEHTIFPECSSDGCVKVNDKESDPMKGATYKRLREINETLVSINEKLKSSDPKIRVSTQAERDYLVKELAPKLTVEKEKLQNDLQIADKQKSLFGTKKNLGIVHAGAIAGLQFREIPLDGEWKEELHRLFSDTQLMFWGSPGSGKTVKLLKFAQYLAGKGLKTLFIANEEFGRSTFTEKIRDFRIDHPNLFFARDMPADIGQYNVIFMDSVQSLGFDLPTYKTWRKKHDDIITVAIIQSTKDGDFRGGKDWEHEMDIAGEIKSRKLILRKNRLDNSFHEKSEKLMIDDLIQQREKRDYINSTVKNRTKAQQPANQTNEPYV